MSVTLGDVAEAAGVSITTASRALTDSDHAVNEETRQRVLRAAQVVGYKPNLLARGLRCGQTFTVGIIIDNICGRFAAPIVRGIQDHLKPAGYSSTIINSDRDPDVEAEAVRALVSQPTDGIIFVDTFAHSSDDILPHPQKPHVFVNRRSKEVGDNCICVVPDNRYGARLGVEHLAQLGHRRIVFINGPDGWEASTQRRAGYQDTLSAWSILLDEDLIGRGDWSLEAGYTVMNQLMMMGQKPTAVFAANDTMAIGAIYAIQDAGLGVPQDVAVVGFDDIEAASIVRPALTTVRMPLYEMGQAAARLLLGQIEGQSMHENTREIQGRLIVRDSCGVGHRN